MHSTDIMEWWGRADPVNIYLFKVNKRNIRKRFEICSKLTTEIPERQHLSK